MLALCPCGFLWVGTGVVAALPPGMELSHRGAKLTGTGGFGSHKASPAHLATCGGSLCCTMGRSRRHPGRNKWGLGFVHSRVEVLLLGTSPCSCSDPAGRRRVLGSPQRVQWLPLHPHFFLISPWAGG